MINLGDKNWGVKDSGLLAYKQVGNKYFNKDFDFTRASNGTYVDKNGVLQTAELYNLLPYSNKFDTWSLDDVTRTGGQIGYNGLDNAWLIQYNTTASRHNINRSVSFSGSGTFSIYAKAKELQYIQIASAQTTDEYANFDLSDGSIGNIGSRFTNVQAIPVGNDWYRLSVTTANGYNFIYISIVTSKTAGWLESFTGANNTDGLYIQDAQLVEGTEPLDYQYTNGRVGIPRIDFSDGVGALLLEPQRSNLLKQSNSFNTTWFNVFSTEEEGYSGIYGSNNAWLVTKNDSGGYVGQTISQSGITTLSVYVKANDSSWVELLCDNGANRFFNLSNGTLGSGTGIDDKIESVGDGWYRCSVVQNASITRVRIRPAEENDTSATSGSIYIQHAQLESGSYPTSIIETTTSAVTRIADAANNCGSEQDFNSEEGVLYAEVNVFDTDNIYKMIELNDGTGNNRIVIYFYGSRIYGYVKSNGIQNLNVSSSGIVTNFNKIAVKYNATETALWINGVKIDSGTSAAFPPNLLDKLQFMGAGYSFYGKARSVKYFPEALGDTKLITLTGGDGSLQGLFNTFQARVLADGGYIESQDCIINEIKELL